MNALNGFVSGTSFDLTVLELLVRVSLILAVAWLLAVALRQRAAVRHAILLAGIVSAFALPVATLAVSAFSIPRWSIPLETAVTPVSTEATDAVCLITTKTQEDFIVRTTTGATPAEATTTIEPCETESAGFAANLGPGIPPATHLKAFDWKFLAPIALASWAVVAVLRSCGLAASLARLRKIVCRARAVDPQPSKALLERIERRVELSQPFQLLESADVAAPLAAGIVGNYILVPAGWTSRLSRTELYSVLCHEAAHLARCDHRIVILQELLASLLWFHPLVYLVNRALTRAREEICDNFAIRSIDRPAYCAALFHLAGGRNHDSLLAATSFISRHWPLEERIRGILDERRPTVTGISRQLQLAIVSIAIALCGLTTLPTITAAEPEPATPRQDASAESAATAENIEILHIRGVQPVADDVRSIRITSRESSLAIDQANDSQLHIKAVLQVDKDKTDPASVSRKLEDHVQLTVENGVLTILPRVDIDKPNQGRQVNLVISVPAGLAIEAQTADGNIAVNQVEASLTLAAHDGDISVKSEATSSLAASCHDGNIAVDTVASGKLALSSHDGSIAVRATRIRGELSAEAFDGSVTVAAGRVDGPLSAVSNEGNVTVELTDSVAGNGEIALASREGNLVLHAAAANKVAANTAQGSITLRLTGSGIKEDLAASTSEGNIELLVAPETNADLALMTRDGSITVEGKESGGNMINTRLGKGGPKYAVLTNNGSIVIKTLDGQTPAEDPGQAK